MWTVNRKKDSEPDKLLERSKKRVNDGNGKEYKRQKSDEKASSIDDCQRESEERKEDGHLIPGWME